MVAHDTFAPPVVHHHVVLHRRLVEEPGQEVSRVPVRVGGFPVAVRPHDFRLVGVHL